MEFLDQHLAQTTHRELRIFLFICRWTNHCEDQASLIQTHEFERGIQTQNGERLGFGAGVNDASNVRKTTRALTKKRFIASAIYLHRDGRRSHLFSLYDLEFPDHYKGLKKQGVKRAPIPKVETAPTPPVNWEPAQKVKRGPSKRVIAAPDNRNSNKNSSNNDSSVVDSLVIKFHESFALGLTPQLLEKGRGVVTSLMKPCGKALRAWTPSEIRETIGHLAETKKDISSIAYLPHAIGKAVKDLEAQKLEKKAQEERAQKEKDNLRRAALNKQENDDKFEKARAVFLRLPEIEQDKWRKSVSKMVTRKNLRERQAVHLFGKERGFFIPSPVFGEP